MAPFYNYPGAGWTPPFSSAPPLPWVTQTHRHTDRQTDRQTERPRCSKRREEVALGCSLGFFFLRSAPVGNFSTDAGSGIVKSPGCRTTTQRTCEQHIETDGELLRYFCADTSFLSKQTQLYWWQTQQMLDIMHTHLYMDTVAVQCSQLGLHAFVYIGYIYIYGSCRISPNPQSCQVQHMHCRQTHRQVTMDYSVGRETDTTPEVCLSVCVSVSPSVECFRTDDVGRSVISRTRLKWRPVSEKAVDYCLCRKNSGAVRLRLTIGNPLPNPAPPRPPASLSSVSSLWCPTSLRLFLCICPAASLFHNPPWFSHLLTLCFLIFLRSIPFSLSLVKASQFS